MYKALVTSIHTRPHPNADKLQLGTCGGYQVIVGKDVEDRTLGLFFEQGGQLSEEFATANDLIRRKDEDGNPAGGMFEANRRVRAIKLRGEKSEGFWCPLSMLGAFGANYKLNEGEEIDSFGGVKICQRYETPATRRSMNSGKAQKSNAMFAKHIDTKQFKRSAAEIPTDALVIITEKLHGTSFRYGRVLDDVPINRGLFGSCLSWLLGWPKTKREWVYLHGSRNVVLGERTGGFYGTDEFRFNAMRGVELHKGEVLYGELVGYTETGAPIMAPHDNRKLNDKEIAKRYGDTMNYTYGCEPGVCKAFVYRITQVNEDGNVFELPWFSVQRRCGELGLNAVPEISFVYRPVYLASGVESYCNNDDSSLLDTRHIKEGVVVRYESPHGTGWLKQKTFTFSVLEGILKDTDDYVDTEEAA